MAIKKASSDKSNESAVGKKEIKKTVKKTAATAVKKVSAVKKAPAKKVVKKVVKKAAKKASAKKVAVKKVAPKKAAAKKTAAKKVAPKKAAKKVPAKTTKASTKAALKKYSTKKVSADEQLVDAAVEGILNVKGSNISILDLRGIENRVCDYYIICQADSSTQVNAIAGSVEDVVRKKTKEKPFHAEGFQNSEWILIDYVTVVVHVFQSQIREFYNLESLWADAKLTKIASS